MKKILLALIIVILFGWVVYDNRRPAEEVQNNSLVATTTISVNEKSDLIVVDTPISGATLNSPTSINGKARGQWFFEASFPIELQDLQGNVLETVVAQAEGEWMTTDFVPFTASLLFTKPSSPMQALLVFKKDNPSGLPEHDDSIKIPVTIQ